MAPHSMQFSDDSTYVFLDVETYGLALSYDYNRPWQLAMIMLRGGEEVGREDLFIKWEDVRLEMSEEARQVTRFDESVLEKKGVAPEQAFPVLKAWVDEADYVVGHNILGFDLYLLRGFYRHQGEDYRLMMDKILDTNSLARGIKLSIPFFPGDDLLAYQYKLLHARRRGIRTGLAALGREFGIGHDYDNLHNAMYDVELTIKVWQRLREDLKLHVLQEAQ